MKTRIKNPFLCLSFLVLFFSLAASVNSATPEKAPYYKYSSQDNTYVEQKRVALTFDDGPHPQYTPQILQILEEKNARATFFTIGFRIELLPNLLIKMKELGCEIGNHTYSHADLAKICKEDILEELDKCNEAIFSVVEQRPSIFRPPFGNMRKHDPEYIEMREILWDIDSKDWRTPNSEKVKKNVVSSIKDGDIILLHDFYPQTVCALPDIIDDIRALGFEFVTVSELLK